MPQRGEHHHGKTNVPPSKELPLWSGEAKDPIPRRYVPEKKRLAASRHNAAQSALLKLPAEIRNRIYVLVMGNMLLHMDTRDCDECEPGAWPARNVFENPSYGPGRYVKFIHTVCFKPRDEDDKAYNLSKVNEDEHPVGILQSYDKRHDDCHGVLDNVIFEHSKSKSRIITPPESTSRVRQQLDLNLLLCCRQIHRESASIPFTSNTFAFYPDPEVDWFICRSLARRQRRAIRSLRINGRGLGWRPQGLQPSTMSMLTGLTDLMWHSRGAHYAGLNPALVSSIAQHSLEQFRVIFGWDLDDTDRSHPYFNASSLYEAGDPRRQGAYAVMSRAERRAHASFIEEAVRSSMRTSGHRASG